MDLTTVARSIQPIFADLPDDLGALADPGWYRLKKHLHDNPPVTEEDRIALDGLARVIRFSASYHDSTERFTELDGHPTGAPAKVAYGLAKAVSDLAPEGRLWSALLDDKLQDLFVGDRALLRETGLAARLPFELATRSVRRYLAFASRCRTATPRPENWANLGEDALSRASHLAVSFKQQGLISEVAGATVSFATALSEAGEWLPYAALLRVAARLAAREPAPFTSDELDELERGGARAEASFMAARDVHRHDVATQALGALRGARGDADATRQAALRSADALEGEAARLVDEEGGAFLAAHLLEGAARTRQDNGDPGGAERLRTLVREYHRTAAERGEPTTVETRLSIPTRAMEARIASYLARPTASDALGLLARRHTLTEGVIASTREMAEQSVLGLITTKIVRGDLPSGTGTTDEERHAALARMFLWRGMLPAAITLLVPALDAIIEKWKLGPTELVSYLSESGNVPENALTYIRVGAERYFARDYVSAICVWVPQVEGIVRSILAVRGKNVTAFTTVAGGTFAEQTLGALLDEAKDALGDALVEHLRILLADKCGLNLRNDLSHGILAAERCDRTTADLVLHALLALAQVPS